MTEKKAKDAPKRGNSMDASLTECKNYDFDKNSFVVEPIFKTEKAETLGSVLLRLMTHTK